MFGGFAPLPIRLTHGDPREVWTPEAHARACVDLKNASLTAPIAVVLAELIGADIYVTYHRSIAGRGSDPTPSSSPGVFTLTWPEFIENEFGEVAGFNFTSGIATPINTVLRTCTVEIAKQNQVIVRTFQGSTPTNASFFLALW